MTITLWAIYLIGLFFWRRTLSLDVVSSNQAFLFAFGVLGIAVIGLIAVWYFLPRNRPAVENRLIAAA